MTDLSEVLSTGKSVLGASEEREQHELIAAYSDAFQRWADEHLKPGASLPSGCEKELRELETVHASVLELAQRLKGKISADLRALKKKGKGILAYTDIFPKRMGRMPPRKM